ncbi:MAG TPA: glycosyltransferase [Gammaproteobacteria bacterium]|nr:glycosyltransferase [Gammaproteobacteria bacterium]
MLKILHAIDTSGTGGAETVFYDLTIGIDPARFLSIPVLPGPGWLHDKLTAKGFHPQIVPSRGSFNLKYLFTLVNLIKTHKIDIIHSHLFGSNVYCSLAGIITKTPVIATFHGFVDSDRNDRLLKLKFTIINKGAMDIVFVSKHLMTFFTDKFGANTNKSHIIYNGVDTDIFQPGKSETLKQELGLAADDIIVGSIGNIRPAKGYDILLKAAAIVKKQQNNIKFVIAGEGSGYLHDKLVDLYKKLDLEDTVFFLGFRNDTAKLLHSFDYFLLSSSSEGFSISTVEAMACGVPIIATKSGGPEEIIEHKVTGLLVPPGEPDLIANAIIDLHKNSALRSTLTKNAVEMIRQKFSLDLMISQYEKRLQEIYPCKKL